MVLASKLNLNNSKSAMSILFCLYYFIILEKQLIKKRNLLDRQLLLFLSKILFEESEIKTKQNKKQMAKTIKCLTIIITSFHLLHANFALSYQLYTRQRNEVEI